MWVRISGAFGGDLSRGAAATALVLGLGLAGCGSSSDGPAKAGPDDATPVRASTSSAAPVAGSSLLGVLSAGSGSFADGKLTLKEVAPQAVWFTDRPARAAGTDGIEGFTKLFFASDDPPNAAVNVAGASSSQDLAVVELSKPAYDRTAGTLAFSATLVPTREAKRDAAARAVAHPGIAEALSGQDGTLPSTFGAVTVFVDSTPLTPKIADEERLRLLANKRTQVLNDLLTVIAAYRQAYEEKPKQCFRSMLDQFDEVELQLVGSVPQQIKQLQSDAEQNGGTLSPGDEQVLGDLEDWVNGAAESTPSALGLLYLVRRGECP